MVSTAMMASSTKSPSARINVPSDTLCRPTETPIDPDQIIAQCIDVGELPRWPDVDPVGAGREDSRSGHRILRVDGVCDLLRRQAELGELSIGNLDVDVLLLIGNEVD